MNQYETGKHVPDILSLKSIAKVLDLPISYFYAEDDVLAELLILYGSLSKPNQKKLLTLVENFLTG